MHNLHADIGDADLNAWIRELGPDLVLTGHIHDSPFHEQGSWAAQPGSTWVINPGHMQGTTPAHVILDSETGVAEWWSPLSRGDRTFWPSADEAVAPVQ